MDVLKGRAPRPALSDDGEGLHFHGVKVGEKYEFVVYPGPKDFEMPLKVARWDYRCDTFDPPELICGDFDLVGTVSPGIRKYRCRGHVVSPSGRIDGAPLSPPLEEPDAVVHGEPRLHAPPGAEAVAADRGELPAALPAVGGRVPSITIRGDKVSGVAEQRSLVLARREAGWQEFMGRRALMVSGATRFCIPSPALSEVEFPYRTTFVFVEREGVGTFWVALERRCRYVDLPDKTLELGFRAQWMLVVFYSRMSLLVRWKPLSRATLRLMLQWSIWQIGLALTFGSLSHRERPGFGITLFLAGLGSCRST